MIGGLMCTKYIVVTNIKCPMHSHDVVPARLVGAKVRGGWGRVPAGPAPHG